MFTTETQSIGALETTSLVSGGEYVGQASGYSYGPLPVSTTVAQTYTIRVPVPTLPIIRLR